MKLNSLRRTAGGGQALARAALFLLLALVTGACDVLDRALGVEAPSRIPASQLETPDRAVLLVNGAIADFDCAFGAYIVMGGLLTDELMDATQTAARWSYDRRTVDPTQDRLYAENACTSLGVYTPLSTARWSAENILRKLEGWTDAQMPAGVNRLSLVATAAAYSGYSHLLLGEGFCSGVLLQADLTPGGEVPPADLFRRAEERFTRAIEAAQASGNKEILNMARVGRARARLNLGNAAGAVADAKLVERNFVKNATASGATARRENRVFSQSNPKKGFAVSVAPEFRNLTFAGVPDPRVPVVDTKVKAPTGVEVFAQVKYTDVSSPLPIATWDEAQLIIAEVEGGQTAVDIINMFHARAGLPLFSSTNAAAIRQQVIEERKRELFLESHHLFDVRRLNLPLSPPPGAPFYAGGVYGNTTCLPLPDVERLNNPNIS